VNKVSVAIGFSRVAEMALLQAWPDHLGGGAGKDRHEIHPCPFADGGRCHCDRRAPSRSARIFKVSWKEACVMSGDAQAAAADALSPGGQP